MRKLLLGSMLVGGLVGLSGCVDAPTVGAITSNRGPVATTGAIGGGKAGEASAYQVLGLFAWGDASIQAAARSGGISKVNNVDREALNVLGIFSSYTTKVQGN